MNMQEIDPLELGKQLRQPSGETGKAVAEIMNISNSSMYALAFEVLDIGNSESILEIGYGNGYYLSRYVELSPEVKIYGIDFSKTMYEDAMVRNIDLINKKKLFLSCGNANTMNYESNSFDVIITLNTIYFWEPFEKQISEIIRVLKPGGKLIIGFRPKSFMEHLPFAQEVFKLFNSEDIEAILEQHGLEITRSEAREVNRVSIEGNDVVAVDACIVARK